MSLKVVEHYYFSAYEYITHFNLTVLIDVTNM